MNLTGKRLLYWAPRALGVAFAIFIAMFAAEAFQQRLPFWRMLRELAVYLKLPGVIAAVLALGWKRPWAGALGFTALGLWFLWIAQGRFVVAAYCVIAGPAFLIATLFFANWIWRRELRAV